VKILLIRHGQAENNTQRILISSLDSPHNLTPLGRKQVAHASAGPKLHVKFARVYVSPLKRTRQTYEILARENANIAAAPHQFDESLREIDMGVYDGRRVVRFPTIFLFGIRVIARRIGVIGFRLRGGESFGDVKRRVANFLARVVSAHDSDDTILLVSHGDAIWGMRRAAHHVAPENNPRARFPHNAEVVTLNLGKSDLSRLQKLSRKC
jgi:alpha-ribazole phosphatase/probable phosphoglycerate mutase